MPGPVFSLRFGGLGWEDGLYRLYLKGCSNETIGRTDFDALDPAQSLIIAAAIFHACSDLASGWELWNRQSLIFSSKSSALPDAKADLTGHQQRIIIDAVMALRGSNWLIGESRKLVEAIDKLSSPSTAGLPQPGHPAPGNNFQSFVTATKSPALRAIAMHWSEARGTKLMPTWDDLSSSALAEQFKLLWGYKFDRQMGDFTGRLAGTHIREWLGSGFCGSKLEDIHSPTALTGARAFLTQVVTAPGAGRCSGRLFIRGGHAVTGERIALPLASDGNNADGILGVSDYIYPSVSGPVEVIHENIEWCIFSRNQP